MKCIIAHRALAATYSLGGILAIFWGLWGTPLAAQQAVRLPAGVNTDYEEREPIPTPDGRGLYFWRRESPDNLAGVYDPGDIWYSRRDAQGRWQPATRMPTPVNSLGLDFVWHVSAGHDTLWLTQNPPGVNNVPPAFSVRLGPGQWSPPQRVPIASLQYQGQYKDYFLAPGRRLLLPNEAEDSYGGTDLYICFPRNDTAWTRPINLGPVINTPGDEDAPCLAPDGRTLYFNSNGHGGRGGHDIFVSYRLDETWRNWSEPVNLGAPVNTPGYDFDFMVSADGQEAFWCSDWGRAARNDIFQLNLRACGLDVYPAGDHLVCEGETFMLEGGYTAAEARYQWLRDGQALPGATDRILRLRQGGTYRLVRETATCRDTSTAQVIRFVPPPVARVEAGAEVICLDDSILLRATQSAGYRFQWQLNGLDIPEATAAVYWARRAGSYTVQVTHGTCATTSAPQRLQRFSPPGLYTDRDSLQNLRPTLPEWLWTNKVPLEPGQALVHDIAAGPKGQSYVLVSWLRGRRQTDYLVEYGPEGLYRYSFPAERRTHEGPRYLALDPDGQLVVADPDRYLSVYRPDGTLLWTKQETREQVLGVATDFLGHIYVAGRFTDTLYLGNQRLTAANRGGLFLAKYSPRGALLWVKPFAVDPYKHDFGNAVHTDCMGNVYLAAGFRLIANFGQGEVLRSGLTGDHYFVAKFSPEGDLHWAKMLATEKSRQRTADVHTDCQGNTFAVLNRRIFHLDAAGNARWEGDLLQPPGSTARLTRVYSHKEDLYVAGYSDRGDVFLTKLNRLYRQVILWQDKGSAEDTGFPAITGDPSGQVYLAGVSKGNGFEGTQFALSSKSPVFVTKYGKPDYRFQREPITLCRGERLRLYTEAGRGLAYQWIRNGQDLAGATDTEYWVQQPGTYQLRISTGMCERLSEPQQVNPCAGAPLPPVTTAVPAPAPVVPRDLSPEPEPEPAPVTGPLLPEAPIVYRGDGTPRRIDGRKVKRQSDIRIRRAEATLYVWDHAAEDRDTVSVSINGTYLLQEYGLKNKKMVLSYTFQPGDNYIILFAHNLGGTPPNTASIMVDDGTRRQTLQLRSTLSNCGMLRVRLE